MNSRAPLDCAMRGGTASFEREGRWAGGAVYAAVKRWRGEESELVHSREQHSLVLTLNGGTRLTGNKISGAATYEGVDRTGCLSFVPGGAERRGWYRGADMQFIALLVDPRWASAPALHEPEPFTNRRDALLESILRALAQQMIESDGDLPALYAEHAAGLALAHLAARRTRIARPSRARPLAPAMLARVLDFIDAHLDDNRTLAQLANLAGLQPDHFGRVFRASVGQTPYQLVLERRMQRAQDLLRGTNRPIAELALGIGFAHQSHFTNAFTRRFGLSPAAYRRQARS